MFVEEHLRELRTQRYAPHAWLAYVRAVGAHVRGEVFANLGAVRSIWMVALAYFAAAFVAAAVMSMRWDRDLAYHFFGGTALWIAIAFTSITLYVGLLRDESGYRLSALNIPLMLTLLRVTLIPGICLFLLERHFMSALVLFSLASLSDVFDGFLARRWGQVTTMGRVMDPCVDVVFNLAMLFGLTAAELLPRWVFWVGVMRYTVLIVGGAYLYVFIGPVRIHPTAFGRATGVVMSSLIAIFTLLWALRSDVAMGLTRLTEIAIGALLVATTVQIILVGWYNLRVMTGAVPQQGRVVDDVRWRSR
ncbi:MAG: CDP-alcohol phosphatidyltransferase family protein [Candidatus Eisenbacteria bacterium]|nr:CDP-alcohol phosphatidyltransferase family protein [Candidatus Eisenbacteria bacterium]